MGETLIFLKKKAIRRRRFSAVGSCCNAKVRRFNVPSKSRKYKLKLKSRGSRILCGVENLSHTTRRYLKRKWCPRLYVDEELIRPSKTRKISESSSVGEEDPSRPLCKISESSSAGDEEASQPQRKISDTSTASDQSESLSSSSEKENVPVNRTRKYRRNNTSSVTRASRCKFCGVPKDKIVKYSGPPADAMKECDVVVSKEIDLSEKEEDKPQINLTEFSVFDRAGHLCAFDGDLIPNDVRLKFSGYVKPIYDDDQTSAGGIPVKSMGHIVHWWIAGFEVDEQPILGFSSNLGDYYLRKPSEEYAPYMATINEKVEVTNVVIKLLLSSNHEDVAYETLLDELKKSSMCEETLLKYSDFVYDQVRSFDSAAEDPDDVRSLVESPCMVHLAQNAAISSTPSVIRTVRHKRSIWRRKNDGTLIKATTTFLVENVFNSLFTEQMKKSADTAIIRPCFVKLPRLNYQKLLTEGFPTEIDTDENSNELDSLSEEACIRKKLIRPCAVRLPRLSKEYAAMVQEYSKTRKKKVKNTPKLKYGSGETDSSDGEVSYWRSYKSKSKSSRDAYAADLQYKPRRSRKFQDSKTCAWLGPSVKEESDRLFFEQVSVDGVQIEVGNFVITDHKRSVAQVKYMWEEDDKKKMCHVHYFIRSCDTILGETGNERELFVSDECEDIPVFELVRVVSVDLVPITSTWSTIGNFGLGEWMARAKSSTDSFFYQKKYNARHARFEEVDAEDNQSDCCNCYQLKKIKERETPRAGEVIDYNKDTDLFTLSEVRWRDEVFQVGSCVFLQPGTLMPVRAAAKDVRQTDENYDETMYPEKYRKKDAHHDDDAQAASEPFEIGCICEILSRKQIIRSVSDVRIKVKKFYRPHNTHLTADEISVLDSNLLYCSDDDGIIKFKTVEGKCFVVYEQNVMEPVADWSAAGPHRFYFRQSYDRKNKRFCLPSPASKKLGSGLCHSQHSDSDAKSEEVPKSWPAISRPLRSMDVFAGCGGLTEGLHQSGVAKCLWAIEKFDAPASAFELNNPEASVFTGDCNDILTEIMHHGKTLDGKELPKKGDVELLCGGPPCQGFSGMNAFKEGEYSKNKNSLIATYLSYCDYFRPRYFILENVRNFVSHEKCKVLKLTLHCLVSMGYQVTFGVLQCGQYGIPQTRRRVIILAAAPGEILPMFPEPTHSFVLNSTHLTASVDQQKYTTNIKWTTAAPYRMVTVGDAISDLPEIENNGAKKLKYGTEPLTHFQRQVRANKTRAEDSLIDHICKPLRALVITRISYVPRVPHADWRDLPNIVVKLPDGSFTEKLRYEYDDVKNGRSSTGALRGVCACATDPKIKCTSGSSGPTKQTNTIIPWCLPHTGNRHGQWNGLYGRLSMDSYFRTVVTNPEPISKQGRVLHPHQNRLVSVRECARSQGFPDSFKFSGEPLDKYAQIGNAVAPPLAKAIGYEIRKCMNLVERRKYDKL